MLRICSHISSYQIRETMRSASVSISNRRKTEITTGLQSITSKRRIEYKRAKTGRLYSIKVEPEAMEIIDRYRGTKGLLCIADRWNDNKDFTKWINVSLKKSVKCQLQDVGGGRNTSSPIGVTSQPIGRGTHGRQSPTNLTSRKTSFRRLLGTVQALMLPNIH